MYQHGRNRGFAGAGNAANPHRTTWIEAHAAKERKGVPTDRHARRLSILDDPHDEEDVVVLQHIDQKGGQKRNCWSSADACGSQIHRKVRM